MGAGVGHDPRLRQGKRAGYEMGVVRRIGFPRGAIYDGLLVNVGGDYVERDSKSGQKDAAALRRGGENKFRG